MLISVVFLLPYECLAVEPQSPQSQKLEGPLNPQSYDGSVFLNRLLKPLLCSYHTVVSFQGVSEFRLLSVTDVEVFPVIRKLKTSLGYKQFVFLRMYSYSDTHFPG